MGPTRNRPSSGADTMSFIEKNLQLFLLLYMLVGGFFFYLMSITADMIFVPTIEQPEEFCEE